jgi:hypothetical protein
MTKRLIVAICVVAASVLALPCDAAAKGLDDLWDVLDNLSGPGPFSGVFVTGKVACWEDGEKKVTRAMVAPDKNDYCLYLEYQRAHADAQAPYERVNANAAGVGFSVELNRFFEVGAGVGFAFFTTTVAEKDYHVFNPTVTPRLVFKPLRAWGRWKNNRRAGFLQMHWRPMVRFGKIDGADFGAPANTFSAGTEVLAKSGSWIVLDVLEAIRGRD